MFWTNFVLHDMIRTKLEKRFYIKINLNISFAIIHEYYPLKD